MQRQGFAPRGRSLVEFMIRVPFDGGVSSGSTPQTHPNLFNSNRCYTSNIFLFLFLFDFQYRCGIEPNLTLISYRAVMLFVNRLKPDQWKPGSSAFSFSEVKTPALSLFGKGSKHDMASTWYLCQGNGLRNSCTIKGYESEWRADCLLIDTLNVHLGPIKILLQERLRLRRMK